MPINHPFICNIEDDPIAEEAGEVLPSYYNGDHVINGFFLYELVQEPIIIPASSPVSSLTIPNLNGDVDGEYLLEMDIVQSDDSDVHLFFNNDLGSQNYTDIIQYCSSAGVGQAYDNTIRLMTQNPGHPGGTGYSKTLIRALSGQVRRTFGETHTTQSFGGYAFMSKVDGFWNNSVDNITQLTISVLTGSPQGTFNGVISLYKRIPFASFSPAPAAGNIQKLSQTAILYAGTCISSPRIITIGSQTRLYYQAPGATGLPYAVEGSEITSWTLYNAGSPVLTVEGAGIPAGYSGIRMGNIILIGSTYYMYYGTEPGSDLYVATSTDGINWTPYSANPILSHNSADGEPVGINLPFVTEINGTYYMYYTNYLDSLHPFEHKVASSPDGLVWTKQGVIYGLGASGAWDDTLIEDKTAYYDGINTYVVYEGYNGSNWCIGVAKSANPLGPFTKTSASPILSGSGISGAFDQYHVATPYLYSLGGILYLFYQGGNMPNYNAATWGLGLAEVLNISLI